MRRRIMRFVLVTALFAPASLFIANQYRTDDSPAASEVGTNANANTGPTTPTTLLTAISAATDLTRDNYPAFGLSFQRPQHWRAQTFSGHAAGASAPIVYLSSDALKDPCVVGPNGTTDCGFPLAAISVNTPLIIWTLGVDPAPVPNTLIDGKPARVGSARPGACEEVQADETIVAAIKKPGGGVFYMQACLRGDQMSVMEQNVYAMLASAKVG